ncbi:hypothetical protein Bp8pS_254 [Bacillus phage vB_BpuM-BpSp]|nr:hypothetical protein Bp8pS_254 [Bacillus phage vB_BpuM-BpSp]
MINQNQIRGIIGNTLKDDINSLKENAGGSLSVQEKKESKTVQQAEMSELLNISKLLDLSKEILISGSISLINKSSTSNGSYEVYNNGTKMYEGTIPPSRQFFIRIEDSDFIIKVKGNFSLDYTLKYLGGSSE